MTRVLARTDVLPSLAGAEWDEEGVMERSVPHDMVEVAQLRVPGNSRST